MQNKKKTIIIVAILMLAVGFASISATLLITGTIKIGVNEDDYEVIFTKAKIGEVDQTITQTNKTADTIIFETPVLKSIDEEAVLDYDVKNTSTQYDAKVKMKCYAVNDTKSLLNTYVSVTGVFDDKNVTFGTNATTSTLSDEVIIPAQGTKSGTITMKLIKSYAGTESSNETSLSIKCEMTAVAGEKSSNNNGGQTPGTNPGKSLAQLPTPWVLLEDQNSNGLPELGDKIKLGSESFYVYENDGDNIKALAEWNLNVGGDFTPVSLSFTSWGSYSAYSEGTTTGMQSSEMLGGVYDESTGYIVSPRKGTITFSSKKYWQAENDIDITDSSNIIYPHLMYYKTKINELNGNVSDVTLISKSEIENMYNEIKGTTGVQIADYENKDTDTYIANWAPSWLYQTSYWMRTSDRTGEILGIAVDPEDVSNTGLEYGFRTDNWRFGVRPVVVIPGA